MNCNFGNQLMIEIAPNGNLYYTHCCVLWDELIKFEPKENFLNSENAKEYLTEIYRQNPVGHNFSPTNNDCNGTKCCDFSKGDFNFLTVSHRACNIQCTSCVVDRAKNKEEIESSENSYIEILKKIKGIGLQHLQLSSTGEPFLYKRDTIDYIANLNISDTKSVGFVTNGIALNESDIEYMCENAKKNGIHISATLSCDGISSESYKYNRNIDAFNKVLKNILAFKKHNFLYCVNCVITPGNIEELDKIPDFWLSKGITPRIIFPILKPEWDWMRDHPNVKYIAEKFPQYFANN